MGSPRERSRRDGRDHKHKSKDRDRSKSKDRERRRSEKDRRRRSRSQSRSRSRSRERRHKRERSADRDGSRKRSRRDEGSPDGNAAAAPPQQTTAAPPAAAAQLPALDAARLQALAGHDAEDQRRRERKAEQAKLDAEMEKRRKRIQAWQEQRRKEEAAAAAAEAAARVGQEDEEGGATAAQKAWTLEDESSDEDEGQAAGDAAPMDGDAEAVAGEAVAAQQEEEEVDPLDAFMQQSVLPAVKQQEEAAAAAEEEEEVDPLDAFMQQSVLPAVKQQDVAAPPAVKPSAAAQPPLAATAATGAPAAANGEATSKPKRPRLRRKSRYDTSSSEDIDSSEEEKEEESEDEAEWMKRLIAGKLSKGDKLGVVDHAAINYPPFRRNFYIEVPELARMSPAEVDEHRKQLDGIKVRGKDVPKPVKNWNQCGLSSRILEVLKKGGFDRPLPIQAQALPIIMSGRDCIGIAKTGSGKTLAFVLPMLRHVKDQPPLAQGDGPVALAMAPTRELVTQIGKEIKRFAKAVGLTCTCVYGGSGVANQITELKRGTEIVVCTPGRMIDILASSGKITNLRRVTFLVLDEADRMFDMGFEPQIMRIVGNVRPDRQTVMFSATFPRQVEVLARQVLASPVEIQVGGRSVVNRDISQVVEIRPEDDRFLRLLELLGEWYEKGKLLIFVSSQDRCDTLFRDLLRAGYPCLSLHGGKDQLDRESTIVDFKQNVCNILVATSVAARGLDVKELVLVVNYDVPNHHEDYVHRVGRTGRAGAKGTAVTFIGPDEEQYAPDLVKALRESGAAVPQDLLALAQSFEQKRKEGRAQLHSSGFGGSGFKFDAGEDSAVRAYKKGLVKQALKAQGEEMSSSEDEGEIREVVGGRSAAGPAAPQTAAEIVTAAQLRQQAAAAAGAAGALPATNPLQQIGITEEQLAAMPAEVQARVRAAQALAAKLASQGPPQPPAASAAPAAAPATAPWAVAGAAQAAQPGVQPIASAGVPGTVQAAAAATAGMPAVVPAPGVQVAPAAAPPSGGVNPMLAAALAAAQRLEQEAGIPASAYQAQQAQQAQQLPVAAQAAMPAALPGAVPGLLQQQQQQPPAATTAAAGLDVRPPGVLPVVPPELAAMMLPPGGMPLQAPAAPAAAAPVVPGVTSALGVPGASAAMAPPAPSKHFETELEINDFPQHARWKVTHRETIRDMGELGAAVVVKGKYYKLGTAPGPLDERKLYLHIEGPTPDVVRRAKQEIKRILEETTEKAMRRETPAAGRYSVM